MCTRNSVIDKKSPLVCNTPSMLIGGHPYINIEFKKAQTCNWSVAA